MTHSGLRDDCNASAERAAATELMSYRAFRAEILSECRQDWTPHLYDDDETPGFTLRRRKILAYRRHLVFRAAGWIVDGSYPRRHIDRALSLDPAFTMTLTRRDQYVRVLMIFAPSAHTVVRLVSSSLRLARTFEGRWFIFRERLPHGISTNRIHFDRSLDYALRHWGAFSSEASMDAFSRIPFDWIRAAHDLRLNDPQSMLAWIPQRPGVDDGMLVRILVRSGALTHPDERVWVDRWYDRPAYSGRPALDERLIGGIVRVLTQYRIDREHIVEALCRFPHHYLQPERLTQALALLHARGIKDLGRVLLGLGTTFANVTAERWAVLLDQFGVHEPAMIVQFNELLASHQPCSVALGRALIAEGATNADLALFQKLLLAVGEFENQDGPVAALSILRASPYSLSFAQVAEATIYLARPAELAAFLDVLKSYGLSDADAVMHFQSCYPTVRAPRLARLLALTRSLASPPPLKEMVAWIQYARAGEHIDSYEYLTSAIRVSTIQQLRQVAKVGFLGVELLRHLVEERQLRTRMALTDWYYGAYGIKAVRLWGTSFDSVTKLLFDDAFTRKAFNYWESNHACIHNVVAARVSEQLGRFPFRGSEEERDAYHVAEEVVAATARAGLLPVLPRMLCATSGILLGSVVAKGWGELDVLTQQLAQFGPLLDDLLAGRGPVANTLAQLDVEAIALVYHVAPSTVHDRWRCVVDHQDDITSWGVAPRYSMAWFRAAATLRETLDQAGIDVVRDAVRWAERFLVTFTVDMARACVGLTPSMADDPDDLHSMMPRLGVLFAVAAHAPVGHAWLKAGPCALIETDDRGYHQVLSMQTLFSVGLADALQARSHTFCQSLPPKAATLLGARLGWHANAEGAPRARLQQLLEKMAEKVIGSFSAWASREVDKFGTSQAGDHSTQLNAIVTKHPAAFFAKEAAKLCTADNVTMWQEARQAHLVVFDPTHRVFQGMALVYREILPRIHPSKPVLVIRAINPTVDALVAYHVSSIVDAFLATAVNIARDSGCVAVALPPNSTQHLLSNLAPINEDIQKRYIMGGAPHAGRVVFDEKERWLRPTVNIGVLFDAYERGTMRTERLHLIWRGGT